MDDFGHAVLKQAVGLAVDISAAGLVAYWEQVQSFDELEKAAGKVKLILVLRGDKDLAKAQKISPDAVVVPRAKLTRQAQISLGVLSASAQAMFNVNDFLVCLAGPCGEAEVDTIQVVRVRQTGSALCSTTCRGAIGETAAIPSHIFNGMLNLTLELAQEGKEGRPIGTIFVLGDHEKVLQFSRQAVLNPFAGHPEDQLSILNQDMKETIREYTGLDGAFIVRSDGTLLAAGRYIQTAAKDLELPQGMGARHYAGAGITAVTEAMAFVISESSGAVTVFHRGQIVALLEKAGPGLESETES